MVIWKIFKMTIFMSKKSAVCEISLMLQKKIVSKWLHTNLIKEVKKMVVLQIKKQKATF